VEVARSDYLKRISTLAEICKCLVDMGRHRVFHLFHRLLHLLLTVLVSTASAERTFSSLKIIKTRLRNKMEDNFLANNMLVHIEAEVMKDYNYKDIIDDFNDMKKKKGGLLKCVYVVQELYIDICFWY
jgi:hypothetical protein